MNSRRKIFFISFLKYFISLGIAVLLFWLVYGDLNFAKLFSRFKEVDSFLLSLSVCFGLLSYYVRAYRWNILLEPLGYRLRASRTFLAVMIGYFANLLVPRMGELTRCAALKRTDNVEFTSSFGTVIAERALDMIILLLVMVVGFVIEFDKLLKVLQVPFDNTMKKYDHLFGLVVAAAGLGVLLVALAFYIYKRNRERIRQNALFLKIRGLLRDLFNGLLSVKKIKRPLQFWLSTLLIWVLYFFMTFIVFKAFEPTLHLGIKAGILVLIMGGLGMATPIQGGLGVFHLFVSGILLLYGIKAQDGEFFAFVLHTSQFLIFLIVGGISFIISLFIAKRNAKHVDTK